MSESRALRALEKENDKLKQQRDDLLAVCEEYAKGVMLLREGAALQLQKADVLGVAAIKKAWPHSLSFE